MSEYWSSGSHPLPAFNHPWLRADGIFETMKTMSGKTYFLDRHLQRFARSASALDLVSPIIDEIRAKIIELVSQDSLDRGRLRLTYFSNGDYLVTHHGFDVDPTSQFSLGLAEHPRFSSSLLSGHKTLAYTEASFGFRIAQRHGWEDLLYLNERSEVVETGLANILVEIEGQLGTPPLSSGALPGILREVLLEKFPEIDERTFSLDDLLKADGLYLLSSIREIHPITTLDINGTRHPFTQSERVEGIRQAYLEGSESEAVS